MVDLDEKCKKYLGLSPYNTPANFLYQDYYFFKSLCEMYGEKMVRDTLEKLKRGERQ